MKVKSNSATDSIYNKSVSEVYDNISSNGENIDRKQNEYMAMSGSSK